MPTKNSKQEKLFQKSMSSDDAGLMAVVAQEMQTSWEKKRKEKEGKFFQVSHKELQETIASTTVEFADIAAQMDSTYESFVLEYAAVEDEIRKIWVQLLAEQQKLLALVEQKSTQVAERVKEREKGQVQGMAIAKRALEDFNKLIQSLRSTKI